MVGHWMNSVERTRLIQSGPWSAARLRGRCFWWGEAPERPENNQRRSRQIRGNDVTKAADPASRWDERASSYSVSILCRSQKRSGQAWYAIDQRLGQLRVLRTPREFLHRSGFARDQDVREPRPTKNIGLTSEAALHGCTLTIARLTVGGFRAHLLPTRNRQPGK